MPLPDTPAGIVEELRREGLALALELDLPLSEHVSLLPNEAADLIEHYERALRRIAAGDEPAREIAEKALDWLARFRTAAEREDRLNRSRSE